MNRGELTFADWGEILTVSARLRVLMVYPRFPRTFWGMDYIFRDLLHGPKAILPPLPLLTLASFFPKTWEIRLIDENVALLREEDIGWADVVMCSVMVVQKDPLERIIDLAHAKNKLVVVGGAEPTVRPEDFPRVDIIHRGEVGDATKRLIHRLARDAQRPNTQEIYAVDRKVAFTDYPNPRYELIIPAYYLSAAAQFTLGCCFDCEFCELPHIYGTRLRHKTIEQVLSNLDGIHGSGWVGSIFFVDDNFIAHIPRAKALLRAIIDWQQRNGFPFRFYTQASINMAEDQELLDLLRGAGFYMVFIGVETPNPESLRAMGKKQNLCRPLGESIGIIRRHGIDVYAAMIIGFDTDDVAAGQHIIEFVEQNAIPIALLNLLAAPKNSRLYARLRAEGRIVGRVVSGTGTDTNVAFKHGETEVLTQYMQMWQEIYEPSRYFRRLRRTHRMLGEHRVYEGIPSIHRESLLVLRLFWHMGIRSRYRRSFWAFFLWSLRHRAFGFFLTYSMMGHHYINMRETVEQQIRARLSASKLGDTRNVLHAEG